MGKRLPYTPNGKIKNAMRIIWLRSRERAAALKATGYCCAVCGVKQSVAKGREVKLDVHHRNGIDWDGIIEQFRTRVLQEPEDLVPMCGACHDKMHAALSGGEAVRSKDIVGTGSEEE